MSLPVKLSVVGLVFDGEVVAAYEGSRRRIHLCVLDDMDPTGLPSRRLHNSESEAHRDTSSTSKPLPVGNRLLPSIHIESEIGQADKHVLKNVSKVERFIQDVVRKVLEDELVYPNFITLLLPENSS